MNEIHALFGKRMRQLAELNTIKESQDRANIPELVLSADNFSLEENVIGEVQYKTEIYKLCCTCKRHSY